MSSITSEENPFEAERPLRSEEDEIRKGIFSKALRVFASAPLEQRIEWCIAIREATSKKPRPPSGVEPLTAKEGASTTETSPRVTAEDDLSERKRPRSPLPDEATPEADIPEKHFTMEQTSECIGAFMRSLLDRVVGGSLNNLAAPALQILCRMLDIRVTSKTKVALYSVLASYYFTHCEKLGKRVSKTTMVEEQTRQDAALLQQLHTKPVKKEKKAPAMEEKPVTKAKGVDKKSKQQKKKETISEEEMVTDSVVQHQRRHPPKTQTVDNDDDDDAEEEELYIENKPSTFRRQAALSRPTRPENSADDEWDEVTLEKRIASIVQLYDPVTVATVVKKLSMSGYTAPDASETVERVLDKFQRRQLLIFDSGIAYLI